jgi:hypothetical protein
VPQDLEQGDFNRMADIAGCAVDAVAGEKSLIDLCETRIPAVMDTELKRSS